MSAAPITRRHAFELLELGDYCAGLAILDNLTGWKHSATDACAPHYLGFPCVKGWGEGILVASLLKRQAVATGVPIVATAPPQIASVIGGDPAFSLQTCADQTDVGSSRSPAMILRSALTEDLLDWRFCGLGPKTHAPHASRMRRRVGVAWASINAEQPMHWKSIAAGCFAELFSDVEVDIVGFQRGDDNDLAPHLRQPDTFRALCPKSLDADDQSCVVAEMLALDLMVTISTTTAHLAAALGVPVILMAARRKGPQWFWPVQERWCRTGSRKRFYPTLQVILTDEGPSWPADCLRKAKAALLQHEALG